MGNSATNKCTKLFVQGSFCKRVFILTDKHLPFSLKLTYRNLVPKTSGGSGIGYNSGSGGSGSGIQFVDTQSTTYVNEYFTRLATIDECKQELSDIENGKCIECGSVDKCKNSKWNFVR